MFLKELEPELLLRMMKMTAMTATRTNTSAMIATVTPIPMAAPLELDPELLERSFVLLISARNETMTTNEMFIIFLVNAYTCINGYLTQAIMCVANKF